MYYNIDELYGDHAPVTIEDYQELNPEGLFEEVWIGGDRVIVEWRHGLRIIVAKEED